MATKKTSNAPPASTRTADLPAHPLVVGLAARLVGKQDLDAAIQFAQLAAGYHPPEAQTHGREQSEAQTQEQEQEQSQRQTEPAARRGMLPTTEINEFASEAQGADVYRMIGYLGGVVPHADKNWQVLYGEPTLSKWAAVPVDYILLHHRTRQRSAAFGEIDILWVNGEAPIAQGFSSAPAEAVFLTGRFTRAGDFSASYADVTPQSDSGLLCEAITPGCCTLHSSRYC
jgi:hypothetical protein